MSSRRRSSATTAFGAHLEEVSWDNYTFKLPVIPQTTMTPSQREQFYRLTLNGLSSNSVAPAQTRLNTLESRFDYPHLTSEIDGSLSGLYNNIHDGPVIVVGAPPNTFTLLSPSVKSENAANLAMAAVNLAQQTCRNGRYYTFHMTVDAQHAYTGDADNLTNTGLITYSKNVALALPRHVINDPAHPDNGVEAIDPAFTGPVLRDPAQTIAAVTAILGHPPELGILSRSTGHIFAEIHTHSFRRRFLEYVADCKFKIFKELIRLEFLGRATIDTSTITSGFNSIRQTLFDRGHVSSRTVEQYYIEFMKQVALYPRDGMYPVDLSQLFWVGLNKEIKDQGMAQAPPPVYSSWLVAQQVPPSPTMQRINDFDWSKIWQPNSNDR